GTADADSIASGLNESIRLGVCRSDAVALLHQMPDLVAMRKAPDGTVVAGGQDHAIANDHRAHVLAIAGRSRSDLLRDRHEVLVPAGAHSCHESHLDQNAIARTEAPRSAKAP